MTFPADLPTLPDPASRTESDGASLRSKLVAILTSYKAAIEGVTGKVGVDSSGVTTSLDYLVARRLAGIADEGIALPFRPTVNFVGAGVTATDNSGANRTDVTVISTGGGSSLGGYFFPESYGAIGNGSNDDTSAIQAAVNAVRTNARGGVVYFDPTKKYLCAGRLDCSYTNGLNLMGGAGNTAEAGDIANEYSIVYTGGDQAISCTTNSTATITAISGAPFHAGMLGCDVSGANIPANSYIESIPGLNFSTHFSSTAVINAAATSSGSITFTVASPFINCAGAIGLTISHLKIHNNNSAFHGDIVAIVNASGYSDASCCTVDSCVIGGTTAAVGNARYCLSFNAAISSRAVNTTFLYSQYCIGGKSHITGNVYSNGIQVENCHFLDYQFYAVRNSHEAWYFKGCTFEPRQDNAAGAYKDEIGAFGPLVFEGCWFGDTGDIGAGAPPWILYKGRQLALIGNLMNSPRSAGGVGIKLDSTGGTGTMEGVTLIANQFFSVSPVVQTTAAGAGITGLTAVGNVLTGTAPVLCDDSALTINRKVLVGNTGDQVVDLITATQDFQEGMHLKSIAGPINDGHFTIAPGTTGGFLGGVDTTNSKLYVKVGATWKSVTLT